MATVRRSARTELREIPGVGPSIEQDLIDLGIRRVAQLRGVDPERMYMELCTLRGAPIDRCMLYVMRCAVYYASRSRRDPELLKWWNWKDAEPARPRQPHRARRPQARPARTRTAR